MATAIAMADGSSPRDHSRKLKSVLPQPMRLLAMLIFAVLAALSAGNAFANLGRVILRSSQLSFGLSSPIVEAALAERSIITALDTAQPLPVANAARTAQNSLRAEPFNAAAMRTLALTADLDRDAPKALARMLLAERFNKRSPAAQLWLIEHYVQRGDMASVLRHYDTALRTDPGTNVILVPTLIAALAEPSIRDALGKFFEEPTPWLAPFMIRAAQPPNDPLNLFMLIIEHGGLPSGPEYHIARSTLLKGLASSGHFTQTIKLYRTFPDARAALLQRASIDEFSSNPAFAPVSWETASQPQLSSQFEVATPTGRLRAHIHAQEGTKGVALRKLLTLSPGKFRLLYNLEDVIADPSSKAEWRIACPQSAQNGVWAIPLTRQGQASIMFDVPQSCGVQLIELQVVGGARQTGTELAIGSLEILRIP